MTEMNLIIPYCCITGKYCAYNNAFSDGFVLGIIIVFMLLSFVEIINNITDMYINKNADEKSDEVIEEKSEEDKKDE